MPELPEVETVRRGLAELLAGRKVVSAQVFDSPKSFPSSKADVEQFLYGAEVVAVKRRAKVLIIDLDSGYSLVSHLKMTGQLVFRSKPDMTARTSPENNLGPGGEHAQIISDDATRSSHPVEHDKGSDFAGGHPNDSLIGRLPDRSTRVQIDFTDGWLFFNDQRKFGWVKLLPTAEVDLLPFMQKLGPEPLDPRTTSREFIERIRRRNGTMIKPAILDQTTIAGVGNIYADESLWAAEIHPETRVKDVTDEQLNTLFNEIRKVLQLSLHKGGSTDKNYVDARGNKGSYLSFAKVFRREKQACYRHPDQEILKIKVAGRGTHICPVCQMRLQS